MKFRNGFVSNSSSSSFLISYEDCYTDLDSFLNQNETMPKSSVIIGYVDGLSFDYPAIFPLTETIFNLLKTNPEVRKRINEWYILAKACIFLDSPPLPGNSYNLADIVNKVGEDRVAKTHLIIEESEGVIFENQFMEKLHE